MNNLGCRYIVKIFVMASSFFAEYTLFNSLILGSLTEATKKGASDALLSAISDIRESPQVSFRLMEITRSVIIRSLLAVLACLLRTVAS